MYIVIDYFTIAHFSFNTRRVIALVIGEACSVSNTRLEVDVFIFLLNRILDDTILTNLIGQLPPADEGGTLNSSKFACISTQQNGGVRKRPTAVRLLSSLLS